MTDHEVYIFDGDPERVVSVTVGELREYVARMVSQESCGPNRGSKHD